MRAEVRSFTFALMGLLAALLTAAPAARLAGSVNGADETARAAAPATKPARRPRGPARWESAIRRFEARDRAKPPPKGAVLFLGSSSIRGWDVRRSFPRCRAINRGFGGSQIRDSLHFADRIILPYRPRLIVFYAGDNDVAAGKTPQTVLADFQALVRKVHADLPKTGIVFIAIKPSIRRWALWRKMRRANALVRAFCQADARLAFVDIAPPMLGKDGRPRKELFRADGLHLNADGYRLWASLVRPHLGPPPATQPATRPATQPHAR